jgi:hypothetical protein
MPISGKVSNKNSLDQNVLYIKWIDNYSQAIILEEQASQENNFDDSIIRSLEQALLTGLTYQSDSQKYFKTIQILAKKYFKYKRYRDAENHLLMLRELNFTNEIPQWIKLYSIITQFKLDIRSTLTKPQIFFSYIDELDQSSIPNEESKIVIIKDYLNTLTSQFDHLMHSRYFKNEKTQDDFFKILDKWIAPNHNQVLNEYNSLLVVAKRETTIENLEVHLESKQEIIDRLIDENNDLNLKIQILDRKILELESTLASLQKEYNTYPIGSSRNVHNQNDAEFNSTKIEFRRHKVLICGDVSLNNDIIYGIAKNFGLRNLKLISSPITRTNILIFRNFVIILSIVDFCLDQCHIAKKGKVHIAV